MKNVIDGMSQEKLIQNKLTLTQAVILKYFVDFQASYAPAGEWFEPGLRRVINDLPILELDRGSLWKHLLRIEQCGFINTLTRNEGDCMVASVKLTPRVGELFYSPDRIDVAKTSRIHDQFTEKHIAETGVRCRFTLKEQKKLIDDLSTFGLDVLSRCLNLFFNEKARRYTGIDDFVKKAGFSYPIFSSQLEKLAASNFRLPEPCPECGELEGHSDDCKIVLARRKQKEEDISDTLKGQDIGLLDAFRKLVGDGLTENP